MRFSRRRRPELPPSSVTVTIAARSEMGRSAWDICRGRGRRVVSIREEARTSRCRRRERRCEIRAKSFWFGGVFFFTCGRGE